MTNFARLPEFFACEYHCINIWTRVFFDCREKSVRLLSKVCWIQNKGQGTRKLVF